MSSSTNQDNSTGSGTTSSAVTHSPYVPKTTPISRGKPGDMFPTPDQIKANATTNGWFPLSLKDGFNQWWSSLSPYVTEYRVLSMIPELSKPKFSPPEEKTCSNSTWLGSLPFSASFNKRSKTDGETGSNTIKDDESSEYGAKVKRTWSTTMVQLSGVDRALNEFSITRIGEDVTNNLVMIHGYGAGLGFFYKNFEKMSSLLGWRVYALDLLGMGRSSRPPFKIRAKDRIGKIREAEDWFVDALEEWRRVRNIDKFTLLGHSLGGYMSVVYALKYPNRVKKLILASPVGIPENPYEMITAARKRGSAVVSPENNSKQHSPSHVHGKSGALQGKNVKSNMDKDELERQDDSDIPNTDSRADEGSDQVDDISSTMSVPLKPLPKWLTYLWDANISPFSMIRWSGPLGPWLVSGWTSRRFAHLPEEEAQALHDYSYSIFRQRGSSEYALAYILAPAAYARDPLINRIQDVGRQANENGIPVVFMYGDHDWMDIEGGYAAAEKLRKASIKAMEKLPAGEKHLEQGSARVIQLSQAGHHLYLDAWQEFNELMIDELKDVEKRA